jgi:chitosanase
MKLSTNQKRLIERVINALETGKPEGNYSAISIFNDGPHDIRQITYGRSQTTEYGKLRLLVQKYVDAKGTYSKQLKPYAEKVGSAPLTDDQKFKDLLKNAGKSDPVMRRVQDEFFNNEYFKPAMKWADDAGLILPLSALVIYDSFIHSGSILWPIRQMFPETLPKDGGNEIDWVSGYVNARHKWLGSHPRPIVQKTIYRTQCFKDIIKKGDWMLSKTPINANGVKVA